MAGVSRRVVATRPLPPHPGARRGAAPRAFPSPCGLASNLGFEHGTDDPSVNGDAVVVPDGESFDMGGAADGNSPSLGPGATAGSRTACVGSSEPTPAILISELVGGLMPQQTTLRVSTEGVPARWVIGDVYVEPLRPR